MSFSHNFPDPPTTPSWSVHRLLERVALPGGEWLDPAAGEGDVIRAVDAVRSDVVWSAIEEDRACDRSLASCVDLHRRVASYVECPPAPWAYRVIISRPRVAAAREQIEKALAEADHVAVLLPIDFLAAREHAVFFRSDPPDVYLLPDHFVARPEGGQVAMAWLVWGPERHRARGDLDVLDRPSRAERESRG